MPLTISIFLPPLASRWLVNICKNKKTNLTSYFLFILRKNNCIFRYEPAIQTSLHLYRNCELGNFFKEIRSFELGWPIRWLGHPLLHSWQSLHTFYPRYQSSAYRNFPVCDDCNSDTSTRLPSKSSYNITRIDHLLL